MPADKVVASGNLSVCVVLPVKRWKNALAAVNVVVPPAVAVVAKPGFQLLNVTFAFVSRNTTELAPLDAVTPVPPFATANVPAKVIAPVVAELGVRPVVPALNDVTPDAGIAAQDAVVPLEVKHIRLCQFQDGLQYLYRYQ